MTHFLVLWVTWVSSNDPNWPKWVTLDHGSHLPTSTAYDANTLISLAISHSISHSHQVLTRALYYCQRLTY